MKKTLLTILLIFSIVIVKSQSVTTQSAFNSLKEANRAKSAEDKTRQLDNARKFIDESSANAETATDAKTWFYKGIIYMTIFRNGGGTDTTILGGAIQAFKKANVMDTKKKYQEEIIVNIDTLRTSYFNKGLEAFKNNDFDKSMMIFERASSLFDIVGQTDTFMLISAATAAGNAGHFEKARDFYETVLKAGNTAPDVYQGLTNAYTKLKDKANATRVINLGRATHPKDVELVKAETNMYLAFGDDDKAMDQLKVISKEDTMNATVFYALGSLYDKIANDTAKTKIIRDEAFNNALAAYKKAIQISPTYFNAYFSAGILYNNLAAELLTKANNLPNDAEALYKKLIAEAEVNLDAAMPYLEKATELDPNDESTLIALKQIYVRKKQTDKAKAINEKLNNLKKK